MPRSVDDLERRIQQSTRAGFRGRLSARGLARNLIWLEGKLPPGSPPFSLLLSSDLLAYGLALFELGLEIRQRARDNVNVTIAFEHAAEAIESVVQDGDPEWNDRGFYTVVAAAAYQLGHFSARAFSMIPSRLDTLNLSPAERTITWLMRRDLTALRSAVLEWAETGGGFDLTLAGRLERMGEEADFDSALTLILNSLFHKAIAFFDYALEVGSAAAVADALRLLDEGIAAADEFESVPFWWVFTIARNLIDDLWDESLHVRLPNLVDDPSASRWPQLRKLFIAELYRQDRAEIDLWPSQLAAARRAIDMSDDLIAALPTSAGKTRIAEICILRALSLGRRVLFVTPLRALSAQTERNLRRAFTPLGFSVSSLYGSSGTTGDDADSLLNRDIVVTTPEKLDFALRNDPTLVDDVGLIVLDEAHTIGAGEREIRYEVLVQRLLRRPDAASRRIVCLSAILPSGDQLQDFVCWIRQDEAGEPITKNWRPTRQRFGEIFWINDHARLTFRVENETPFVDPFVVSQRPKPPRKKSFPSGLQELTFASALRLVDQGQTVLIYCPQRRSVNALAKTALTLHRQGFLPSILKAPASALDDALNIGHEWLGEFHPAVECLKLGIAVHHAKLPRPFLRAVEVLLKNQALSVTIASPTLAQGLNLSATTVLFYSLMRGREAISGEEFANVAGRAGRAFVDVEGQILCVATERKHISRWNKLLRAAKERDLRSGLFQLVQGFCKQLAIRKGYSSDEVISYVMGNAAAWDPPRPEKLDGEDQRKAQDDFERKWRIDLACLDSALLSLVQQDVPFDDLAKAIDDALHSSLWQRTLRRQDQMTQKLSTALLLGRAGFIWSNSTAAQRKGYFFAGVSFATGRYLDEHADALNRILRSADENMAMGRVEEAINAIIEFAKVAFAVEPFQPDKLPGNWEGIVRAWIRGQNMADLAGAKDADVLEFIEDGLVYRLVWAMEAVRVRAIAIGGEEEEVAHTGRAALAIETGTSDRCAALLIQSGLPSRVAAMKAVSDCPAHFDEVRGLRTWLRSGAVTAKQHDPQWPTPETANLWREFVINLAHFALRKWDIHAVDLPALWENGAPLAGSPVRIFHSADQRKTMIYSVDLNRIGSIKPPLSQTPSGILLARAGSSTNSVSVEYLGPDDLVRSSSP